MMAYNGYLRPYMKLIRALSKIGAGPREIATIMFDGDIRPYYISGDEGTDINTLTRNVSYVVRTLKNEEKSFDAVKVTKVVMDWQTWTPAMQEAEFQMGYSR